MADHDEYQPPTIISRELDVPLRTIERWARQGHIRTRPSPTRRRAKLYHRDDAERLAAATVRQSAPEPESAMPEPATPTTEIVPQGELLRMLDDTQRRLEAAMHEAGRLRGQLEAQQKLLEASQQAHADLQRLPWWVRILFLRRR